MNAEELEGVLQDMDYRFTPSDEHQASGISFNEMETENYGLGILEYNNEICKM